MRTDFLARFLIQTAFGLVGNILEKVIFHSISAFLHPVIGRKFKDNNFKRERD